MSEKLYEIDAQINAILAECEENGGEMTDDMFDRLQALQIAEEIKVEGIALAIKILEAEADMIKRERDALYERQSSKANRATSMRAFLSDRLINTGRMKFETPRVALSFRRSTAVDILDESAVPAAFRIPQPDKIDKTGIGQAIKAGQEVKGAQLVERQNLQVK